MTASIKATEDFCMYCCNRGFFRDSLNGGDSYCTCVAGQKLREVGVTTPPFVEQKTVGSILHPRHETPQRLIRELLDLATERCAVCKKLATRSGTLKVLAGRAGVFYFCDAHTFKNVSGFEDAPLLDLEHAPLLRRCLTWLEENKVEEKTSGGVW